MSFEHTVLGRSNLPVFRLGLAATYGVPAAAVEQACEQGVNYLYWGSRRTKEFQQAIHNLHGQRDRQVLVIQSYSRLAPLVGWSLERALRRLRRDRADVLLLGLWNHRASPRILEACRRLRDRGLTRFLALSTHYRPLVVQLAGEADFDIFHVRYNAVHRGAESDVFPQLPERNSPGIVSFTATNWRQLLDARRVPAGEKVPAAGDCYRFVLSHPGVQVCLSGPANAKQMRAALAAVRQGPFSPEELAWMRRVGDAIYRRRK